MTLHDANIMQFPPITQPMAIAIVQRTCNVQKMEFNCYAKKPKRCNILASIQMCLAGMSMRLGMMDFSVAQ